MNDNKLRTTTLTAAVRPYKHLSQGSKALAEGSGQASFYGMLMSAGLSLLISFVLYIFRS